MTATTSASPAERTFDLILVGATGYTGKLVAEALARRCAAGDAAPGRPLRWALAGRSLEKLEAVRKGLVEIAPGLAALPLIVVDTEDEGAVARTAQSTHVVATTVGPYARYGKQLLAACAEHGTHYCDLTGEIHFIRWAIDTQQARAAASGARIVPCCGFDSIPSDLGVYLAHDYFARQGRRLASAVFAVEKMKGGASGGTVASMLNLFEEAGRDPGLRKLLADPYGLLPDRTVDRGLDEADQLGVRFDEDLQSWTAPFIMAAVNTRVVRRTNALLGHPYGRDFRYREVSSFPKGARGFARAATMSAGLLSAFALGAVPALRSLFGSRLPAPGQGPTKEQREAGCFRIRILGKSAPDLRGAVLVSETRVEGFGDPGYAETAKMLSEAALCLRFDELPARAGILTPAAAMGTRLIERLRERGMNFDARLRPD